MSGRFLAALVLGLALGLAGLAGVALAQPCLECHVIHGPGVAGVHFGGAGACNVCHTMHNSQDGTPVDPDSPGGNEWLLVDATPSDVCLNCHADWISDTFTHDPLQPGILVGGGDFVFLLEDNLNDGYNGANNPIGGDAAGHNLKAPSRGVGPDGTLANSPGGSFPSSSLGCTSCHDPHGNGNFRMLYGLGQSAQDGLFTYSSPAPTALGNSIYHGSETNSRHSAFRAGMSEWCGNCHGDFHNQSLGYVHPSGSAVGAEIAGAYNAYSGTDNPTGGSQATAYLAAVPFEDPAVGTRTTFGPSTTSRVICLSCHRAHASSAPDAGRWDFAVTFLTEDGDESGSYAIPSPYASANQRSLCNKCHLKDLYDAPY